MIYVFLPLACLRSVGVEILEGCKGYADNYHVLYDKYHNWEFFLFCFYHILVIILFLDEIDEIYKELDDEKEVCTNQLFATIVASYRLWQNI